MQHRKTQFYFQNAFAESSRIVTGPSLTSSTCIVSWKRPVSAAEAGGADFLHKIFVEFARLLRRSGRVERWTLAAARVSVESELRDHQQRAAHVGNGQIHFAAGIFKNAQADGLLGKVVGVSARISRAYSERAPASRGRPRP